MNQPPIIDQTRPDQTRPDRSSCPKAQNSRNRKVLLVTLYGNFNYGNILQRIALAGTIEALGFEVTHLCRFTQTKTQFSIKKFIKQSIKRVLAVLGVKKFREQFRWPDFLLKITKVFTKFQDKYVQRRIYTDYSQAISAEPEDWFAYDYAVTGSDQVWHIWGHTQAEAEYYYLSFMPREKRVCYAPSFGFSEFTEQEYEFHRKGLAGFERLSCREQEMIPMIRQASGKDAQLVLDPTLLMTAEDWRKCAAKPSYKLPEKYVLCYFLGNKTPEYLEAIRLLSEGLPVISVYDPYDKAHVRTDPGGFVWLIDHADFVCTDSFHGTAFSVNFRKNFMAFRRKQNGMEDMFGRISGLLDSLNITGHVWEQVMTLRLEPVNYEEAYSRLDALRESSMHYLRDCLR